MEEREGGGGGGERGEYSAGGATVDVGGVSGVRVRVAGGEIVEMLLVNLLFKKCVASQYHHCCLNCI